MLEIISACIRTSAKMTLRSSLHSVVGGLIPNRSACHDVWRMICS